MTNSEYTSIKKYKLTVSLNIVLQIICLLLMTYCTISIVLSFDAIENVHLLDKKYTEKQIYSSIIGFSLYTVLLLLMLLTSIVYLCYKVSNLFITRIPGYLFATSLISLIMVSVILNIDKSCSYRALLDCNDDNLLNNSVLFSAVEFYIVSCIVCLFISYVTCNIISDEKWKLFSYNALFDSLLIFTPIVVMAFMLLGCLCECNCDNMDEIIITNQVNQNVKTVLKNTETSMDKEKNSQEDNLSGIV